MPSSQKIKQCFFIGPMKDMGRLLAFRDNVLVPLFKPYGFAVGTPDAGEIGNVMKQVLLGLEQADILIADITNNNPNVMYELGIYHAFGKPYLVIKEDVTEKDIFLTPFDIAEFRYHVINFKDSNAAQQQLKPLIQNIIGQIDKIDWFGNPVTDFYNSPVAEIPTAIGLFKNYRKNFLEMLLPDIFQKDEYSGSYKLKIFEETEEDGKIINRVWSDEERDSLTLEIPIPEKMNMTSHSYIAGLKNTGKLKLKPAKVQKPGRPFSINYSTNENGDKVIVDIPTILSTLNESIEQRRKLHKRYFDNVEWELLEQQELERFTNRCESFKKNLEEKFPECDNRLKILTEWKA